MTFLSIDSTQHLFVHKMLGITPITNCSKLEGLDMIIFLIEYQLFLKYEKGQMCVLSYRTV